MKSYFAGLLLAAIMLLAFGCEKPPPILEEGRWTGMLIPLSHPDQRSELFYRVGYANDQLTIVLGLAGQEARDAREVLLTADSLKFAFDEPEAEVPLRCAFGLQPNGTYEGLCADRDGKSAYFTMRPPDPFGGDEA